MTRLLGKKKDADATTESLTNSEVYRRLWLKFSTIDDIESKSPERESAEREFGGFISTDGISVHVKMKATDFSVHRSRTTNEENTVDNVKEGTMSILRRVQTEDMTNKVVIVVDGGKSPILTAGYYQTNSTLDATGKLGFTPFHLSAKQREDFEAQRPTHQRRSTSWRNGCQKSQKKAEKKEKRKRSRKARNQKRQPINIQHGTRTQRNRREYGHFFQVPIRYWREISGQQYSKRKLIKWMEDQTIVDFQKESCKYSRTTPLFEKFQEFTKFTLAHLKAQLVFYGRKCWRRLKLDGYMKRKRAIGEICRRFFPKGVSKDDIVVIWGDGDYKHNAPGTVTTPKDMFSNSIRRSRPSLFLPGCEFKSSQKCPECHEDVQQAKMKGNCLSKVLQCKSTNHSTSQMKFYERYETKHAIIHLFLNLLTRRLHFPGTFWLSGIS